MTSPVCKNRRTSIKFTTEMPWNFDRSRWSFWMTSLKQHSITESLKTRETWKIVYLDLGRITMAVYAPYGNWKWQLPVHFTGEIHLHMSVLGFMVTPILLFLSVTILWLEPEQRHYLCSALYTHIYLRGFSLAIFSSPKNSTIDQQSWYTHQ